MESTFGPLVVSWKGDVEVPHPPAVNLVATRAQVAQGPGCRSAPLLTPLADGLTASELEGGEVIQGSGQARETPKHAPSYESLPTSMME